MIPFGVALRDLTFQEYVACARLADTVGLDSIWLPEPAGGWDPTILLAALSGATRRIRLATGVVPVFTRHPLQAVMIAATLDEVSGGRFMLGVGAGNKPMLRRMGVKDVDKPLRYLREFVRIFRSAQRGRVSHEGRAYNVPDFTQRSHRDGFTVPLYIAAHNPQMLNLAGEIADGVLLNLVSPADAKQAIRLVHDGAKSARRRSPPRIAAFVLTCLGPPTEALYAAKAVLASFCGAANFRQRLFNFGSPLASVAAAAFELIDRRGPEAGIALIPDDLTHEYSILGGMRTLEGRLAEYQAAGIDLPILSIFPVPLRLKQFFPPLAEEGFAGATMALLRSLAPDAALDALVPDGRGADPKTVHHPLEVGRGA